MSKAKNWIQEERRKTLGDWVAFCLSCGHAVRYFDEFEEQLPAACPDCGGELLRRCSSCGARFTSVFDVECDACGAELRRPQLFGVPIRKPGR